MADVSRVTELLPLLDLALLTPVKLESERRSDPPAANTELQLETNLQFSDDDPIVDPAGTWTFRPRMVCTVSHTGVPHFHQASYFLVKFRLLDTSSANELWKDAKVRQDFQQKQLTKTLWPLFRQHVIDGMSRVGLPSVTLPWLL